MYYFDISTKLVTSSSHHIYDLTWLIKYQMLREDGSEVIVDKDQFEIVFQHLYVSSRWVPFWRSVSTFVSVTLLHASFQVTEN